jgi:hypothetical protein
VVRSQSRRREGAAIRDPLKVWKVRKAPTGLLLQNTINLIVPRAVCLRPRRISALR